MYRKLNVFIIPVLVFSFFSTISSLSEQEDRNKNPKKYLKIDQDWYETYVEPTISKTSEAFTEHRKLFFPPGAKLVLDPKLKVPLINQEVFGVGTAFEMSFPITFALDKLSLSHWNDLDPQGSWTFTKLQHGFDWATRKKRSIADSENSTMFPFPNDSQQLSLCTKLGLQKLAVFKKLESLISSYNGYTSWRKERNDTGESCLLRAICEMHQFPVTETFGVFGDLLKELVRVDRFTSKKCSGNESILLKKYIDAQENGGSCKKYTRMCKTSFFYH